MKKQIRKQEGITLVALVVTIIVLLILAGVTISLVLGQTGIFSKAKEAKIKTEESGLQEEIKLAWLTVKTNHKGVVTGKEIQIADELKKELDVMQVGTTAEYKQETKTIEGVYKQRKYKLEVETGKIIIEVEVKVEVGQIVTQENKAYIDANGKVAIIPVGFGVVPGCETIEEGLVISDVENDTANTGNQFVWIPVDRNNSKTSFARKAGYAAASLQNISSYAEIDSLGLNSNSIQEDDITIAEAMAMYTSVNKNGGFYIGRYEAGKDRNGEMVVKKNTQPYVNITWGNSMTDSKGGAVELARNFAVNQGYDINQVHSTLCYSVQWDTALSFIDPEWNSYVKDGTGNGNYSGSKINTGTNETYKRKNIYDMAGNVWEWTMEAYLTDHRVIRGGSYGGTSNDYPSSMRNHFKPIVKEDFYGFRPTLYL